MKEKQGILFPQKRHKISRECISLQWMNTQLPSSSLSKQGDNKCQLQIHKEFEECDQVRWRARAKATAVAVIKDRSTPLYHHGVLVLNQISFGSCTNPFSDAVSLMWELHVRSCNCSESLFWWSILGTISWMLWKKFLTILVAMSSDGLYLFAWQNGLGNCQIAVKLLACQHDVHMILHDWHCKLLGLPHTSWEVGFGNLIWSGVRPPIFKPPQICIGSC
jgi:hypothetical protein